MKARWRLAWVWAGLVAGPALGGQEDWTHLGQDASRQSIAVDGPTRLLVDPNQGSWKVQSDPCAPDRLMQFEGASGAVLYRGIVYAYAQYLEPDSGQYTHSQVVAVDACSGQLRWRGIVDQAYVWGSHSTPCVDTRHNTVLIGSGRRVFALDANDGHPAWAVPAELRSSVVNASLCTALDVPHARAFITDYSYESEDYQGRLYCINLDANEPDNPFEPGQVVWDVSLGAASGDSPSYANGIVYVASADGRIYAYDAAAAQAPALIWETSDPNRIVGAFFGGVTVTRQGFLYAATYNWDLATGENNSTLVKLDRKDGRIVWTVAVERTDTMPVVVGDRIYVSGGLSGFGSVPKVQAFRDLGDRAELLWDTSVALPGVTLGSWTAQPAYAWGKLYVGGQQTPYDASWRPNGQGFLYILDVNRLPGEEGFVLDWVAGCGNSPVVTHDSVYSVGPNAVMRFCQPRALADINGDGTVDAADRQCIVDTMGQGYPLGTIRADLDLDGDVDGADLEILEAERNGVQP